MARLAICSDLHLDIASLTDAELARLQQSLFPDTAEALIIAGDLADGEAVIGVLEHLAMVWDRDRRPVFFIPGNHDYFGVRPERLEQLLRTFARQHTWFRVLIEESCTIAGRYLHGTTLWYPEVPPMAEQYKAQIEDFQIPGFDRWHIRKYEQALRFLRRAVHPGDIVISHHLPSEHCIAPMFVGHPMNPFFVGNTEAIIRSCRPSIWIHGHTHMSLDFSLNETRIIANPRGYAVASRHGNPDLNEQFVPGLLIEV